MKSASADELRAQGYELDWWTDDEARDHYRPRLTTAHLLRVGPAWAEIVTLAELFEEPARRYLAGGHSHPTELQPLRWG